VLEYLKKKGVDYYVVTEQRHNNLAIVDQFIRTLRDYLRKNKPMTDSKINQFLKANNKTIHKTTGVSPAQMQDNKDLELQYITESMNKQNTVETQYLIIN
jgi:hypothetical protein